ncbi:hypothetical protein AAFF_G00254260 [Aldrovandia affinis]|uniref:CARD domain-containing protein n=1 Tax=Aldrovandia affinis TaxID=143900 RepID=A0AAD7W382_9TELE|nr:hypothetical protein AAFF_G00254260 [Aldrovandia affinis]
MRKKMDAASEFVERNRSAIIERLSAPGSKAAADHLLNEKCISNEDYEKICKSITNEDKVRELYNCMKAGKPKSHFIFRKFLKKSQPYLLDALVRKKRRKRKVISRTSDVQVEKRLRTQEPPATGTGPGPDQNQGQEARDDETDSGSTPDFRRDTLSAMQEYLEDPVKSESMISVLKSKLGEKEMVKLESLLEALMPKRAVGFNHEDFRNISKNRI